MKKFILTLGSALMIYSAVNVQSAKADDMAYGIKGGVGIAGFGAPELKSKAGKELKSELTFPFGGGLFFDYRLLDDVMAIGLEVGYKKRDLTLKAEKATKADLDIALHCLDFAFPISWLPMGYEEGGLFVRPAFVGYIPLAGSGKEDSGFNCGVGLAAEYEISGLVAGLGGKWFFLDTVNQEDKKGAKLRADKLSSTNKTTKIGRIEAELVLGYNLAPLFE